MADIIVKKPSQDELDELGVSSWPIWTCETSTFDWHYDQSETCYIIEGEVVVTAGGREVLFGPGDMVTFPQGLECIWQVKKPVRKHYRFS